MRQAKRRIVRNMPLCCKQHRGMCFDEVSMVVYGVEGREFKAPSATRQVPPCGRLLACIAPAGGYDRGVSRRVAERSESRI